VTTALPIWSIVASVDDLDEALSPKATKKPATFDILGITYVCARSRKGKFTVHVKTMKKRFKRGLRAMSHEEIVQRFKRVFGREMTPSEREIFFLPDGSESHNEMP
jgi:hypothetical protein